METIKLDPPLPRIELPDECSYERMWALLERYRKAIIKCLAQENGISVEEMEKNVELLTVDYKKREMKNPKYRVEL